MGEVPHWSELWPHVSTTLAVVKDAEQKHRSACSHAATYHVSGSDTLLSILCRKLWTEQWQLRSKQQKQQFHLLVRCLAVYPNKEITERWWIV